MKAALAPGAYLAARRAAAGMTVADVAARLTTNPPTSERERIEHLELLEADEVPATWATISALRRIYSFDLDVLARLDAIAQGASGFPPQLCRSCACSERDACDGGFGHGCHWVEADLCSSCASIAASQAKAA